MISFNKNVSVCTVELASEAQAKIFMADIMGLPNYRVSNFGVSDGVYFVNVHKMRMTDYKRLSKANRARWGACGFIEA